MILDLPAPTQKWWPEKNVVQNKIKNFVPNCLKGLENCYGPSFHSWASYPNLELGTAQPQLVIK